MEHRELPSIYNYMDVKTYLREYRDIRRGFDPGFTNTYICYVLGQKNSKGYFNNVISGRVRIGSTLVERFVTLLALNRDEAAYLRVLVQYSQTKESEELERLLRQLISLNRKNATEVTEKGLSYYLDWRYAVVRALLDIVDYDGSDWKALNSKLLIPLKKREFDKAMTILEEVGLIVKNRDGFFKPNDSNITPDKTIQKELLIRYQAKNFLASSEVMVNPDVRPQKATTMTLSISQATYEKVKASVDRLKEEIRSLARLEEEAAERLYQLNIHLFPHSTEL